MMNTQIDVSACARLVQAVEPGATLLRVWPLTGGVSAQVTALKIGMPGGHSQTLVVRQHGAADLRDNPQIAADEFRLLEHLHAAGVAVPAPRFVDPSGQLLGTPCLVIEYVAGSSEPPAHVDAATLFAEQLARIHRLTPAVPGLALPNATERCAAIMGAPASGGTDVFDVAHVRAVLAAALPFSQRNPSVLLHGDYWPGNILWNDDGLVAVIDWEDAGIGDPLADLANSRLEVLWAWGEAAMERFSARYQTLLRLDTAALPGWELCAALHKGAGLGSWGLPAATEQTMSAQLQRFVGRALAAMPG